MTRTGKARTRENIRGTQSNRSYCVTRNGFMGPYGVTLWVHMVSLARKDANRKGNEHKQLKAGSSKCKHITVFYMWPCRAKVTRM
jgi:hypothetical protein